MLRSSLVIVCLFCAPMVQAQEEADTKTADQQASGAAAKSAEQDSSEESPAQDKTPEGHSYHGEAFNEGPRQAAYLMDSCGKVSFPITTENDTVQQFFNQGVAQLHGFWYLEAERSFRQVAAIEPECAMAYWGMAMANINNTKRAADFIAKAAKMKDTVSERERMYIEALDAWYKADKSKATARAEKYTDALEKILYKYPDDLEAKAFLGLQMWVNRRHKIKIQSHLAVDALLQQVLKENPLHPCHHYVIHLWDHERSENALHSAAMGGASAPGIAHMWHMPGHIYSDLKRYQDAVWQQEASARVDHAHMMRDEVLPDQIHNFAHNNEWLIRNLIKVGRVADGLSLAQNMTELPRHPKYNHFDKRGSAAYGRMRLYDVLNTFELWDELIALSETPYLEPTDKPSEQIKRLRNLGRAWFRKGNREKGEEYLALLEQELADKESEQKSKGQEAADKVLAAAAKKSESANSESASESTSAEAESVLEKATETESAAGDEGSADAGSEKASAKQAGDAEKKTGGCDKDDDTDEKKVSTPDEKTKKAAEKARKSAERKLTGEISNIKNAIKEMKGHVALLEKDYDEALKRLKDGKDFPAEFRAEIQLLAGRQEDALKTARDNVSKKKNEVRPLACLIETLWQCDKKEDARKEFDKLREISGALDDNLALFRRLDPIAQELGFDDNWRVAYEIPEDFGTRPSLDSLGPFRWQPHNAKPWTLPDVTGAPRSLADYAGEPVVVIFYLGSGCLHCAEQLQAFGPKTAEFREAGFSLIAISTDAQDKLTESHENYDGDFPFPLVADPELDVFRKYRAYDDFEEQPLHGTFLIDGAGRVLWHDISYEPFMDADFLIKEGRRLINQIPAPVETVNR